MLVLALQFSRCDAVHEKQRHRRELPQNGGEDSDAERRVGGGTESLQPLARHDITTVHQLEVSRTG